MSIQRVPEGRRTAVYWWYDPEGIVLYVGCAYDPDARGEEHRRSSLWFQFAAGMGCQWFPDRHWAEYAEADLIRRERPIFNYTYNTGSPRDNTRFIRRAEYLNSSDPSLLTDIERFILGKLKQTNAPTPR